MKQTQFWRNPIVSNRLIKLCLISASALVPAFAQTGPSVRLLIPEYTRLLRGQFMDVVIEVRNATKVSNVSVNAGGVDISSRFSAPVAQSLDCTTQPGVVLRANLQSFETPGDIKVVVTLNADGQTISDSRALKIVDFNLQNKRNIILFIGDSMGTSYRDAARLVSRSIVDSSGNNSFRGGYFDNLLEMDKMPVSGMSMTYSNESVVPDSANTATAWASGNKTFVNALNVLPDGTDCIYRPTGLYNVGNLKYMLDNPRVETLWQFLRRKYGYRAGIVSTAAITDATPAGEGSYVSYRQARLVSTAKIRCWTVSLHLT
jgi:alkaline phosphatase